jgi:hypothetical protein
MMVAIGRPGEASWWPGALGFYAWAAGPMVLPWLLARRRPRWFMAAMLGLFLVAGGCGVLAYRAMLLSESSTAALALVFVPLYQWLALGVAFVACLIAARIQR